VLARQHDGHDDTTTTGRTTAEATENLLLAS
jgi:hypothetical protein